MRFVVVGLTKAGAVVFDHDFHRVVRFPRCHKDMNRRVARFHTVNDRILHNRLQGKWRQAEQGERGVEFYEQTVIKLCLFHGKESAGML